MDHDIVRKRALMLLAAMAFASGYLDMPVSHAQLPTTVQSPLLGKKLKFEVASVKQNIDPISTTNHQQATFPMGPGNMFTDSKGIFTAKVFHLIDYIGFAYKLSAVQKEEMQSKLPSWAQQDWFDIDARADGDPTKDQMREMMKFSTLRPL